MNKSYLVTIFVPVYNGQKYLEETLKSIMNQSYSNLEILLVDDSSNDCSLQILSEFAEKDSRFKIFLKENGGMVPKSFNYIIPHIKGDFFFYSSQDDLFSPDLIENMVRKQIEEQADTVLPDMEFYFENGHEKKRIVGLNSDRNIILTGRQALIESLDWSIHGFALFRTSLIREEYFPEDAFDSDEFVTRKMFLKSNKIVFCEGIFYYRQDNINAVTKTFSKKNFYTLNSLRRTYELLKNSKVEKTALFTVKLSLFRNFLTYSILFDLYKFDSSKEKSEVKKYLSDFRKDNFINSFYLENFNFALKNKEFKFIFYLFVFTIPLLFYFFKLYILKKHRKSFFKLIH